MHTYQKELPAQGSWASSRGRLDLVGASLSLLCLAHCMILPLLPLLLTSLPWLANEKVHLGLLVLITPTALFALFQGMRHHGKKFVFLMGLVALAFLFAGPMAGEAFEKPFTVAGALLLCGAHLVNRQFLSRPIE